MTRHLNNSILFHRNFMALFFGSVLLTLPLLATTKGQDWMLRFGKPLHPLDPLTPTEIKLTSKIIKEKYPNKNYTFMGTFLNEPPKSELYPLLLKETTGILFGFPKLPRKSLSVLYEFGPGQLCDATVNLYTKEVERFVCLKSGTLPILPFEDPNWGAIILKDIRVQAKIKERGVKLESVHHWLSFSPLDLPKHGNNKLFSGSIFFAEEFENDNVYAHPMGIYVVFDLNEAKVVSIEDCPLHDQFTVRDNNDGVIVPKRLNNFDSSLPGFLGGHLREDVKPLKVEFSEGPSYHVEGNEISWQKFKFRISFNYREGLVLHNIIYKDGEKIRPLFYRLSISESGVFYGDPRPPYHTNQFFDEGSYGLGFSTTPLIDGKDCIGATTFFNATLNYPDGSFLTIPNAICLSEEDNGILWKHTNEFTGKRNIARSRRITLTQIINIGNYDYIYMWHFYQDASIELEMKLSGILHTQLLAKGATPFSFGTQVFPQVNAPYHQHIFAIRIDPMIDGKENTVSTIDVVPVEESTGSSANIYGNGFTIKETVLKTAGQARTNVAPEMGRFWKISNDKYIHPYTMKPMGYKLVPMNSPPLMMGKNSPIRKLNRFAEHSVWVTPYMDNFNFIAGFYNGPNQNGIPEWVDNNKNAKIENKDIVIWHTFTKIHIPRVEDFPVMPQTYFGFTLKPYNFFTGNPAVDVP